ncbi:MAG TPA: DUF2269 family protein [Acidimicrobiia bacterium]
MVLGAINDDSYNLVLVLHILAAIVGFGAVFLNAIYGAQVRARRGPEGLAIFQANFLVSNIATYFIYAVFVFGFLLVLMSDDAWSFGDPWVWLSMLLYVVGVGLSHGVLRPNVKRMMVLMEEMVAKGPDAHAPGPPPQAAEMEARGKRVGATSATLNVLLVVILYLMVFKPGA